MTVRRTPLGDIVTTKYRTEPNELGVEETWEDVTVQMETRPSDTARLRMLSVRDQGVVWP